MVSKGAGSMTVRGEPKAVAGIVRMDDQSVRLDHHDIRRAAAVRVDEVDPVGRHALREAGRIGDLDRRGRSGHSRDWATRERGQCRSRPGAAGRRQTCPAPRTTLTAEPVPGCGICSGLPAILVGL